MLPIVFSDKNSRNSSSIYMNQSSISTELLQSSILAHRHVTNRVQRRYLTTSRLLNTDRDSDTFWTDFGKTSMEDSTIVINDKTSETSTSSTDPIQLSHTDDKGRLHMVDISEKSTSSRVAMATGVVYLGKAAFDLVRENKVKKGDVITVAEIAGICGAKKTSVLIPLCHNIPLSKVDVSLELCESSNSVRVTALAKTYGKTGVEMEALTGVTVASLTVYDMCKAVSKDIVIGDIKLEHKSGGKSGDYNRN